MKGAVSKGHPLIVYYCAEKTIGLKVLQINVGINLHYGLH